MIPSNESTASTADQWYTSCCHHGGEPGYRYGCEHIECAIQSSRYGGEPGLPDWTWLGLIVIRMLVLVAAFFYHPLLAILIFVGDRTALILHGQIDEWRIKSDLNEFYKHGTIRGEKAVQLFHHNDQCEHVTAADFPSSWRWIPEIRRTINAIAVSCWLFILVLILLPGRGPLTWPYTWAIVLFIVITVLPFQFKTGSLMDRLILDKLLGSSSPTAKWQQKYDKYLTTPPPGKPYTVTVRKVTNPDDEWLRESRRKRGGQKKPRAKRTISKKT